MKQIHPTLNPKVNMLLIVVWGVLACGIYIKNESTWFLPLIGLVLGSVGGGMQFLSLKEGKKAFKKAKSMLEIRAVLAKTLWGKRYLYFHWISFVLWFGLVIALRTEIFTNALIVYFSYMFARELVTLPGCFEL